MSVETLPEPPKNESAWSGMDWFERAMLCILLAFVFVLAFGLVYLATGGDRRWAPNLFPPRPQRVCCECCKHAPMPESGK